MTIPPSPLILLASNDEDYHLIVGTILEEIGFPGKVETVKNYQDMMRLLERKVPQGIVMDLIGKWRSALAALKKDKRYENIPVAVLSASDEEKDVAFCEQYKFCSFVQKPIDNEGWKACMRGIVGKSTSCPMEHS